MFGMGTGGTPSIKPPETLHMRKRVVGGFLRAALDPGLIDSVKQLEEKNDQAARAISIGQLNALRRLHLRPINVVVFDGSSGGCPREAWS